jgi:hypothetical protein
MKQKVSNDPLLHEIEGLKTPLGGKRLVSWLLFVPIIIGFLALPVVASIYPDCLRSVLETVGITEKKPAALATDTKQLSIEKIAQNRAPATAFHLDKTWNPGPLASAHAPWAHDCKVCHSEAFAVVKDKDCLVCHSDIGDHVDKTKVTVAGLDESRCESCHRDHKGALALKEQNIHYTGANCASCHSDIKASTPKTELRNVKDFAKEHPEFRIQVATGAKAGELKRVRLDAGQAAIESTNLKFPHDIHLADKGIKGPKGRVTMECADCHTPDATGVGFNTVTMKDHCQSCHELRFEVGLVNRQVPHGSVEEVLNTLREVYAFLGGGGSSVVARAPSEESSLRLRPGVESPTVSETRTVVASGGGRGGAGGAANAARELFEKTSCVVCHQVSRLPGPGRAGTSGRDLPQYAIAPIRPEHAWMPKAVFNHKAHRNEKCSDCHAAKLSQNAKEVLMPSIETCRDCHVGSSPVINKIASDCGMCHGFHMESHQQEATPASKPASKPKLISQR